MTIPRNHKRTIAALRQTYTRCIMHSKRNDYIGREFDAQKAWEHLAAAPYAKLYQLSDKLTIHITETLWFDLYTEEGQPT